MLRPLARSRPPRLVAAMLAAALTAGCASSPPPPAPAPAGGAVAAERGVGALTGARTIGIPPFANAGLPPRLQPLAFALADLLATDLSRAASLTLVERARLGEILRELDLAESGKVDPTTAPRVGRLVQARTLVLGGATATGTDEPTLRLAVRLADVPSGTIAEAVDASAPLADILDAQKALAFRVLDALGVTLTPRERAEIDRRPTRDLAALLAYGSGVQQEYLGNFRRAADEFRRAQRLDPTFTGASVRAVEARTLGEIGTNAPLAVPGVRAVDAAVGVGIDVINRPLVPISRTPRVSGTPEDPSYPITTATLLIRIVRP